MLRFRSNPHLKFTKVFIEKDEIKTAKEISDEHEENAGLKINLNTG